MRKLITVLQKCNGKAVVGDSGALISPAAAKILAYGGLLVLTGALFLGVYIIAPAAAGIIRTEDLARVLMMVLMIMSFVLALKNIVTVLYTADDLALLMPLPFSAGQIVLAKLVVASAFPMIVSFIALNALCLGFGVRTGEGAGFIIGTVLSSVLIPVTGIFAAVLLVVIIFRLFGFIRNRDITVAIGGICTLGLTFGYIIISNKFGAEGSGEEAAAALRTVSSVSAAFPNISFMNRFMFEGSIPGLLVSLCVTAAVTALAMLAVRAFYLDTALSMQTTAAGHKALSEEALRRGKKKNVLGALTSYEAKSSRRNPAYLIYGFVMSLIWPVLFALPLIFGNHSIAGGLTFPLATMPALLACLAFAITASCFSCGFNILPGTAFSREGSSFEAIRALPVDLKDYYRSKRNFSMLICSLGSVLYVVILGIVCVAAGVIPAADSWIIPVSAGCSFLLNLLFINLMLLKHSGKPRFNWDSETELSRKLGGVNLIIIVLGVIMLVVLMAALAMAPLLGSPGAAGIILVICGTAVLLILILALTVNALAVRTAAQNLMKLE